MKSRLENKYLIFIPIIIPLVIAGLFFFLNHEKPEVSVAVSEKNPLPVAKETQKNNLPASASTSFNMIFFGDLMLDRRVGEQIKKHNLDYLFRELDKANLFRDHDLVSANLEGAVTDKGAHYPPVNSFDFVFNPDLIAALKNYNFTFFNSANNHFTDQGQKGVDETRKNLAALNYDFVGCPDKQVGDCSTKIIDVEGGKIGMAGFSEVYGLIDNAKAQEKIRELKKQTELVIVNVHWGVEYQHDFNKFQKQLGHDLIDAGADVVIGHHPHVVEGMEVYQGKPIFYSLGNFIFDQYFSPDTQEELAVEINFTDNQKELILHPMQSVQSQPRLMTGEQKSKFLEKFLSWSKVSKEIEGEIKEGKIKLK